MEAHKERYAPFVDDDRGLDVHLGCMRQPGIKIDTRRYGLFLTPRIYLGTYGGHLELTAFAHLKRRDVKVIQPGLVYVIEWRSGAELSPTRETPPVRFESEDNEVEEVAPPKDREARRLRREKKRELKEKAAKSKQNAGDSDDDDDEGRQEFGAVYVA